LIFNSAKQKKEPKGSCTKNHQHLYANHDYIAHPPQNPSMLNWLKHFARAKPGTPSCCELMKFDCQQGRNCPARQAAPTADAQTRQSPDEKKAPTGAFDPK
jgi:hypothetical protein